VSQDVQANPAEQANAAAPAPQTLEIADLDTFVKLLMRWHRNKVKVLNHMANIPEGSEMTTIDGKTAVLGGEFRAGFQAGITLSLMELGELPFAFETEPTVAAAANDSSTAPAVNASGG
jgi:hypothetical protein